MGNHPSWEEPKIIDLGNIIDITEGGGGGDPKFVVLETNSL